LQCIPARPDPRRVEQVVGLAGTGHLALSLCSRSAVAAPDDVGCSQAEYTLLPNIGSTMISRTVARVAGYTRKVTRFKADLQTVGESESWALSPSHQLRMHCQNQNR
jgi:hypothetical protein